MKIPFDIKFRPQIESGEYKVENRDGRPVRIICWDKKSEKKYGYHIVGLVEFGPQHEESTYYTIDGKGRLKDKEPELFLITPEPELSEFEIHLLDWLSSDTCGEIPMEKMKKCVKNRAAELLELARKELEPEVLERLEIAYKNQDEVVYENGKREGKAEAFKEIEQDPESSYAFKRGFEYGKEEALKDLPRWRYKRGGTWPILHDCIVLNKYGCISKSPSGALLGDVWTLEYDELTKLPKLSKED